MKNITEALNWRYATKKFDSEKKINKEDLVTMLEALRLSPSSYGLQPWKFIVINNTDIRSKIRAAAYDQSQITDASQIIVFANKKNIDDNLVDEYLQFVSKEKNVEISHLEGFGGMIKGSFKGKTNEELKSWASCQLYLAVGTLLTSCAVSSIDACPMEGFDRAKVDEILGLSSLGLESKVIVAMGYRSSDDDSALSKKIRFPKEEVFIEIN
jgi:nitroreductase